MNLVVYQHCPEFFCFFMKLMHNELDLSIAGYFSVFTFILLKKQFIQHIEPKKNILWIHAIMSIVLLLDFNISILEIIVTIFFLLGHEK